MPCWYYDKKELRNTPSALDTIDYETELRYRREGARFIIDTGSRMGIGYNTTATGVVYFHRFYMFHSFKKFPRFVTACCCLFLAGKVEETPKKCKDIIKTARTLLTDAKFATFGEDPKEEVMTLERILLQTIKFDLQVEHPYSYLLKYAKFLKGAEDKDTKLQKMVQMAWTFVNDSLCTTLSLQWEPEIIAVALMYLASKLSKFEVFDWAGRQPKHLRWWDMFIEGLTLDLLEDICHQVLDLYSQPQSNIPDSPPLNSKIPPEPPGGSSVKQTNGQEKETKMEVSEAIPPPAIPAPIPEIPPPYPPYPASFPPAPQHPTTYPPPPYTNPAAAAVAPLSHIVAPPPGPPPSHLTGGPSVPYPTYVAPPPHYPPVMPPATYYQPTPPGQPPHSYQPTPPVQPPHVYQPTPPIQPPHRPYYPPPS